MQRQRFQSGCLFREQRSSGAVWCFRYRDSDGTHRKQILGTVEQFPTKAAASREAERYRININDDSYTPKTVGQLVAHFTEKELPNKTPYTREVYRGYLNTWILPKWGEHSLHDVRTIAVEEWLHTLPLANGTRAKLRNLMSAIYNHGIRWEWFTRNPIQHVRQSAKRERVPDVLTAEEIGALLAELEQPYRCMIFVAASTGLRVSELLGLQWADINFDSGTINLSRGIVRQHVGEMKTEASRKPLPLSEGLAEVLKDWREQSPYNQPGNWLFASPDKHGKQPYWPNSAMEKHIRPAAERAGIKKRVGWHTFRHSFATLLKANGEDVKTVQECLRHANSRITLDVYTQAVTPAKIAAQAKVVEMLFPNVPKSPCARIASA
jgi:integrase